MTRRVFTLVVLLVGPLIGTARTATDGVQVTPSSGTIDVPPYAQAQTQVFSVKNTGSRTVDFSIQAGACQPFELNCAWSTFSLNGVGPNQSVPLTVTFTSGAPGWSGTISFVAKVNDNQSVAAGATITVRVPSQARVETKSLNPGTTLERSRCVSFGMATNSAYECGDLVIANPLPSLRVRGDDRTPVLLYTSTHAEPRPVVLANVSAPAAGATNVKVALSVRRGGSDVQVVAPTAVANIPGDSTRRIGLTYDASSDTTGVYPYTFTVTMTVAGAPQTLTASDTLVVVNRKASAFGAGWWLAGYERLVRLPGGGFLWVGGDGSTRRYVRDTTRAGEAYGAAGYDRPDSLVLEGTSYVRKLRHGARVVFDANGRHVATKDPLGFATTFDNDPASGRLRAITHPGGSQHQFFYSGSTPLLDSATAPAPNTGGTRRKVALIHAQRGKVTRITDADGRFVGFDYQSTNSVLVWHRTNRNNVSQGFGILSSRLISTFIPVNATESANSSICPAELQGLVAGGCGGIPLSPGDVATSIDGPRPNGDVIDVTKIKTDRFGAPLVVTDAVGNTIRLYRGNRAFAGLVTRVVHKNGWVNEAFYTTNGLIGARVEYAPLGPGRDAVTTFQWDPKWERITRITYPEGDSVRFGYDSVTGNRIWQEDGRGTASRVNFRYYGSGGGDRLLRAAEYPKPLGSPDRDSIEYDSNGNVAHVRQLTGNLVWTARHFVNDAVGRTTSSCTDIDLAGNGGQQCQFRAYDLMDRDSIVTDSGPPSPTDPNVPAQAIRVTSFYDAEGNLTRLDRLSFTRGVADRVDTLRTQWAYDRANRRVSETAGDGASDSLVYDLAGNTTRFVSRRTDPGNVTTRLATDMTYDALNRLTRRVLPTVTYPTRNQGIPFSQYNGDPLSTSPYPRLLKNVMEGLTVAADTETFAYDEAGAVTGANNGDARVSRRYYANGLIQAETLKVRDYTGSDFSKHVYGVGYEYDLDGRRSALTYPVQLTTTAAGTFNRVRYQYDPGTGSLATVTDLQNNVFTFAYDLQARVDSIQFPGRIVRRFGYDGASRLNNDFILNRDSTTLGHFTATRLRETTLGLNSRGDRLLTANFVGKRDTLTATYYGLGYLGSSSFSEHSATQGGDVRGSSFESFIRDGLANDTASLTVIVNAVSKPFETDVGQNNTRYQPKTARQVRVNHIEPQPDGSLLLVRADSLLYDASGNVIFSWTIGQATGRQVVREDRAMFYAADGRLRVVDHRTATVGGPTGPDVPITLDFDEHRYDALGRRVLTRTQRECVITTPSLVCGVSTIRRTVWDGSQELVEIQQPGHTGTADAALENDSAFAARQPIFQPGVLNADLNPFYGRVAYTVGPSLDQPLSVTRWAYQADSSGQLAQWQEPFTIVPHWNVRGEADNGAFADGSIQHCGSTIPSRCLRVAWPFGWTANQQKVFQVAAWHGSLLEQKRDGSGLLFKRNRYLDPTTGKFTQEDPIGLAGGLNLYGFANGDPVNYSDPFGLWPPDWGKLVTGLMTLVGNYFGDLHLRESTALVALEEAEVLQTAAEKADELTEGMQVLRKAVPAGGAPPNPLPREMTAASIARGAGGRLLPAAGLGVSILTSYKHGENESLPETVCRIEKCDPSIKVIPDNPKRQQR